MEQYSLRRMRFYCKLKKRRLQNCTPSVRQYIILSNRWGDFNAKGSAEQKPCSGRAEIAGAVVGAVKIYAQIYLQAPAE